MRKSRFTEEQIANALQQAEYGPPYFHSVRSDRIRQMNYFKKMTDYGLWV